MKSIYMLLIDALSARTCAALKVTISSAQCVGKSAPIVMFMNVVPGT